MTIAFVTLWMLGSVMFLYENFDEVRRDKAVLILALAWPLVVIFVTTWTLKEKLWHTDKN